MTPALVRAPLAMLMVGLLDASAWAQTNERVYEDLSFRFGTPGARAAGMGRSFIGLADDATAADSNPAGLANLLEREVTFEFTATSLRHHRFTGITGNETQPFGEVVGAPSFGSFVFPLKRLTLSPFYNVAQHYRETFDVPSRVIPTGTVAPQSAFSEDGTFGDIAIDSENVGLAASYVATRWLAIGWSLGLNVLQFVSSARSGSPDNPKNGTDTDDTSVRPKFVAGVLAKPIPEFWIGAAYHGKVTHPIDTQLFGCFADNTVDFTLCKHSAARHRQVDLTGQMRGVDYVIPDRWVVGVSAQPVPWLVGLSDFQYVRYSSRLTDRFLIVDFINPADGIASGDFSIRSVWEYHGGAEFRIRTSQGVIALRGGAFSDPEHQLRYTPRPGTPPHENLEFRFNRVPSKTDWGGTLGFGMTFRNVWQFDVAFSAIRTAKDVAVSVVKRFP